MAFGFLKKAWNAVTGQSEEKPSAPTYDWSQQQIAREQEQASRAGMAQAGDDLRRALAGAGPSVAQQQLDRTTEQNQRQAASMAASARGGGAMQGIAQRDAMMAGAQAQQQAVGQAALMRAQEQAGWMQQYAALQEAMRAQDQAKFAQETGVQFGASADTRAYDQQRLGVGAQNAANQQKALFALMSSGGKTAAAAGGE